MKKRILTMLLAVCLVLALGTVSALADGNDESSTTPLEDPNASTVAMIGNVGFSTLSYAFEKVQSGQTIVLQDNLTLSSAINIAQDGETLKSFTLDLGGHTVSYGGGTLFNVYNANITVQNGTINYTGKENTCAVWLRGVNSGLTLAENAYITTNKDDDSSAWCLGVASTATNANVVIDGTLDGAVGFTINGMIKTGNVTVTVNGTIKGYYGLYLAGMGTTTINDGAVIDASSTGVEIRAGELNVYGGRIAGGDSYDVEANPGGTTTTGVGIAVAQHTTELPIVVNVYDGTITGSHAFSEADPQNNEDSEDITLNISGGSFQSSVAGNSAISIEDSDVLTVVGGIFKTSDDSADTSVEDFFPDGSSMTIDPDTGKVEIDTKNAVATVNGIGYPTLQAAIAAVPEGGTIEIIDDILDVDLNEGSGQNGVFNINSGMAFTINGNGHTIRVSTDHANADTNVHVFNVTNGEVTFTNLTVDGGGYARHGIQAHGAKAEVILNNVTSINNEGYGVIANAGGTVTANYLTTDGNGWGGVNVEANGQTSTFNMKDGNLKENASIVFEDEDGTGSANAKLDGGNFNTLEVKTANVSIDINGGSYDSIVVADDVTLASGVITVDGASFNEPVSGIAETEDYQVYYGGVYAYYDSFSKAWNAVGRGNANAAIAYVGEGSGAAAEVVTFKVGEKTVTYTVPYGFEISLPSPYNYSTKFLGWECSRDGGLYKVNAEYTVYRDVTFTATYEVTGYNIYIDRSIENGEVSTSPSGSAAAGETVYIYVDPDTGYVLDELTASWGYNYRYELSLRSVRDGVYRFTMPEGNVYITATFERSNLRMPFTDVNRGDWFYDAVYYVWANDMMEGVSDTSFNPNGSMTRAMFWAVLGRIDGETITGSDWVEEARDWAMSEGVSDGENPYALVTREQMVTMLWRYAGEPGRSANLNRYTDAGSISDWAEDAMEWAIARGVIDGMTSTTLQPQGTATRAHCATIFMRYDQL